jgi:HAD superfamily hydrolase (TIGR01509 family)
MASMTSDARPDLTTWAPAAVVFDNDGLLVDTEPCWTVAETELFARRGLGFGPEQKALMIGKSVPAAAELLTGVFGEPGAAAAIAGELLALVGEIIATSAAPMPGAAGLVAAAASRVPVAVASNSPRALLDTALRRAGLDGALTVRVAADEVPAAKPAPDIYLAACARLGIPPERCVAFEDSLTGLRSAQAAGLRTVGVPTLAAGGFPADLVVPSLRDDQLLAWVASWPRRVQAGRAGPAASSSSRNTAV